ncbi:GNAT family N-acetyltransferase [Achromobacter denitrificans]|uniref:GNAT family N-acetyltransferase n=1 Tax=Achromobacter denitrificans TaxID=32002 RepID=UPI000F682685|nr:GNAT family N-acetyltransferase [Achromobacter denitrificans]MDF3848516.1 GNAT family N-acetyltransferase [Achromobacter denitrificans]RSE86990.1 GNAT family N-acetyltransferase [Achromobacter denitrificans]
MDLVYRKAVPDDAEPCIALRGQTRENAFSAEALATLGITRESWRAGIEAGDLPGHVAMAHARMAGYCFADRDTGEVLVLALLPEYEGKGIGKELLSLVLADLKALGFERAFLACSADPRSRSHGFYRHLGWQSTGQFDEAGDEVLERRW